MISLISFAGIFSIIAHTVIPWEELEKTSPPKVQEPAPEAGLLRRLFSGSIWFAMVCGMITPRLFPEHSFLGAPEWQTAPPPNSMWDEDAMSILGPARDYDYNRDGFLGFKYFSTNAFLIVFSIGMLLGAVTLGFSFLNHEDDTSQDDEALDREGREISYDAKMREEFLGYAKAIGNFVALVLDLVLKAYLVYLFCRILLCETEFGEVIMADWYVRFAMLNVVATSPTVPIFSWLATGFGYIPPWVSARSTALFEILATHLTRVYENWSPICDAFGSTLVKFISEIPRYLGRLILAWVVVLAVRDSLGGSSVEEQQDFVVEHWNTSVSV